MMKFWKLAMEMSYRYLFVGYQFMWILLLSWYKKLFMFTEVQISNMLYW